jgi:hypothetical protein
MTNSVSPVRASVGPILATGIGGMSSLVTEIMFSVLDNQPLIRAELLATHRAGRISHIGIRLDSLVCSNNATFFWQLPSQKLLDSMPHQLPGFVAFTVTMPHTERGHLFGLPLKMFFDASTDAELETCFNNLERDHPELMIQAHAKLQWLIDNPQE